MKWCDRPGNRKLLFNSVGKKVELYRVIGVGRNYVVNMVKIFVLVALSLAVIYSAITYAANKKVERQKYRIEKTIDGIEVRFYPRAVLATVKSPGENYMDRSDDNFRSLAGYIFGGNASSSKIAMTAPVHMEVDSSMNTMSFVMPSGYDIGNLPAPENSSVTFRYSREGYYAAIKFGGFANNRKIDEKIKELKAILAKLGYKTKGGYTFLGYNAPWDVVDRENEVIVEIEYQA